MQMLAKTQKYKIYNLVVDIEEQLRRQTDLPYFKMEKKSSPFGEEFAEIYEELQADNLALQKYVNELLEKYGPRRRSGRIDTVCFYENCCISAATWSNYTYGTFSKETILKIIAGLECTYKESEKILMLAGFYLTNSDMDRLFKAAILSGHNNTQDMYDILEYYSKQYPKCIKNYYKDK